MRHGMAYRKLGRTSSHRGAMLRNQIASMIQHERIVTTLVKAKEVRPLVEKMVTLGKTDSVHSRRLAAQRVTDNGLVQKLFTDLSPRFNDRPGGYTRIVKLGPRRGDGTEMAILEFVDYQLTDSSPQAPTKGKAAKPAKAGEGDAKPAKKKKSDDESGEKKAASKKTPSKKTSKKSDE